MLVHNKSEWSPSYYSSASSYLKRYVFPIIGGRVVVDIEAPDIIPIMTISNRGAIDAAKRVKGFIQQVFDFALTHGKCSRNPAKI